MEKLVMDINPKHRQNEIRYNFETKTATITATTQEKAKAGYDELARRGLLKIDR